MRSDEATACAIDGLAVHLHPLAHLLESLHSHFRKTSVRLRADVHEEVGVASGCSYEVMNESGVRLIVLVSDFISPHAVHRLASLKGQTRNLLA